MFSSTAGIGAMILFVLAGFIAGVIYDVFSIFKLLAKGNLVASIVADIATCLLAGFIFIFCIFRFEFGVFAFFEVLSFVIGATFEQIFVKNLIASPIKWVYNKVKFRKSSKLK